MGSRTRTDNRVHVRAKGELSHPGAGRQAKISSNHTKRRPLRKLLRDAALEILTFCPFSKMLFARPYSNRVLLWVLFHLERNTVTVARAGPRFCRYPLWVNWQTATEFCLGIYEGPVAEALRRHVRCDDFCIAVGAHVGYYAVLMAHLVGRGGFVIAFEPFRDNFELLQKNIALNRLPNVVPELLALADKPNSVILAHSSGEQFSMTPSVAGYAVKGARSTSTVAALALDTYFGRSERLPDLIQIDVEGAELAVLQGAVQTLKNGRPKLLIELHGWDSAESQAVTDFLAQLCYKRQILGNRGREAFVLFLPGCDREC
jgi:FkbM family methyltransferase